jgi:four helix bundle protein
MSPELRAEETHTMFQLENLTLQIIQSLKPLVEKVAREDKNLADQLRRSATSVALNVSESAHARGNNRNSHLQIAAGSANESRMALKVAIAWGYLDETHTTKAQDHLDHCIAVLWKLTH